MQKSLFALLGNAILSYILIRAAPTVAQWVSCAVSGPCTEPAEVDARLVGIAIGGLLALAAAGWTAQKAPGDTNKAILTGIGTVLGAAISIGEQVQTRGIPDLARLDSSFYLWLVALVLVTLPLLLGPGHGPRRWLLHLYSAIGVFALCGLVAGGVLQLALMPILPEAVQTQSSVYILAPSAVVAATTAWAAVQLAPWILRDFGGWAEAARREWLAWFTLAAAVLIGGAHVLDYDSGVTWLEGRVVDRAALIGFCFALIAPSLLAGLAVLSPMRPAWRLAGAALATLSGIGAIWAVVGWLRPGEPPLSVHDTAPALVLAAALSPPATIAASLAARRIAARLLKPSRDATQC